MNITICIICLIKLKSSRLQKYIRSLVQRAAGIWGEGCTWRPKLTPRRLFCLSTRPFLTAVRFFLQYNPALIAKITEIVGKSVSLAILVRFHCGILRYSNMIVIIVWFRNAHFYASKSTCCRMKARLPFPFHPSLEFNTDLGIAPAVTISSISNRFSSYFFDKFSLLFEITLFITIIILY